MAFKRNNKVKKSLKIGFQDPKIALEYFVEVLESWGFFVQIDHNGDTGSHWIIHVKSGYEQREGKYRLHYLIKSGKLSIHKHYQAGCVGEHSRVLYSNKSPRLIFEKFKELKETHLESLRKKRDRIIAQIKKAEEGLKILSECSIVERRM